MPREKGTWTLQDSRQKQPPENKVGRTAPKEQLCVGQSVSHLCVAASATETSMQIKKNGQLRWQR